MLAKSRCSSGSAFGRSDIPTFRHSLGMWESAFPNKNLYRVEGDLLKLVEGRLP